MFIVSFEIEDTICIELVDMFLIDQLNIELSRDPITDIKEVQSMFSLQRLQIVV